MITTEPLNPTAEKFGSSGEGNTKGYWRAQQVDEISDRSSETIFFLLVGFVLFFRGGRILLGLCFVSFCDVLL